MNILLKFRTPAHDEAYTQDFAIQLRERFKLCLLGFIFYLVGFTVVNLTDQGSRSSTSKILYGFRLACLLFVIISTYCLGRKWKNPKKSMRNFNMFLDIFIFAIIFTFYPLGMGPAASVYGQAGIYISQWSNGYFIANALMLLSNWWIRSLAVIAQFLYFIICIVLREDHPVPQIAVVLFTSAVCVCWMYLNEKYERLNFLEKRKVYENFEALKKIFDDVSQGIAIIERNDYSNFYQNHSLSEIFDTQSSIDWKRLFPQIKVRKISPYIEISSKSRVYAPIDTEEFSERSYYLSDYLENLVKMMFDPQNQEKSVTAETSWASSCSSEETQTKNLLIKFTPSLFMGKAVIVINVTDTTDRDNLIAAEASNAYKSRLLASVSHELRTPLNGSMNFTEQAINDPTVPHQVKQKCLIPALRAGQLLLSLINDILDFSQMQAGKLRLVFESKNVFVTAKECIDLLEIQANKKGITLELKNYLKPRQQTLFTDHNRLRQVILNLLSNAVKFTFKGGVTLILEPATNKHDPMTHGVQITCKDTGIGINEKEQKKLFQAFEKIELGDKASMNSTGVGLGLIISNNLVHRLNNTNNKSLDIITAETEAELDCIKFESKENVGTTFTFSIYNAIKDKRNRSRQDLPAPKFFSDTKENLREPEDLEESEEKFELLLEHESIEIISQEPYKNALTCNDTYPIRTFKNSFVSSPGTQHEPQSSDPLFRMSKPSRHECSCPPILIVDDDAFNLTALEQILHKLRFTCDLAFHGAEALEKIQHRQVNRCSSSCQQYKVVFLDCNMPVMNGYETCKILKKKIKDGDIDDMKVIMCTATADLSDIERASTAGTNSYCVKPVTIGIIREKLIEFGMRNN